MRCRCLIVQSYTVSLYWWWLGVRSITSADMDAALADFVPASLRGVKLFKGTAAWHDVGGLQSAKRILKETIAFPIKYGVGVPKQLCPFLWVSHGVSLVWFGIAVSCRGSPADLPSCTRGAPCGWRRVCCCTVHRAVAKPWYGVPPDGRRVACGGAVTLPYFLWPRVSVGQRGSE